MCNSFSLHKGAPREIQEKQHIHRSVFEAIRPAESSPNADEQTQIKYEPRAVFSGQGGRMWKDNYNDLSKSRLEDDPFISTNLALQKLRKATTQMDEDTERGTEKDDEKDTAFEDAIELLKGVVPFSKSLAVDGEGGLLTERE